VKTTRPLRRKKEMGRGTGLSPGCGKTRYTDELAAKLALADIARPDRAREGDEKRAYKCPFCQGWHLTSQPRRPVPHERKTAGARKAPKNTGPSGRVRALVLQRDSYSCVCCGQSITGRPHSVGHRKRRSQGGTNEMTNLLTFLGLGSGMFPDDHHFRIDSRKNPHDEAQGYTVRSHEDPALVPVMLHSEHGSGGLVWLTESGGYSTEAPEAGAA